jgi:hypothetical protein
MSFNPSRQPIAPFQLLGDSLSQVAPIYLPILIIASPGILINVVQEVLPKTLSSVLTIVYSIGVLPILTGISVYFIHRYLKQGTSDLSGAVNQALSQSGQLILGMFLYGLAVVVGMLFLILPGIYLAIRFGFLPYAIVTENRSAIDGFKYSSELVKGRWWPVFGSTLLVVAFLLPVFFAIGVAAAVFARQPLIGAIIGSIVGLLFTPPISMYYVKLYMRLQETANFQSDRDR